MRRSASSCSIWLLLAPLLIGNGEAPDAPRAPMPEINPVVIAPSKANPAGMKTVAVEPDNYAAAYLPNVEYARRGERALRLQILRPAADPRPGAIRPRMRRRRLAIRSSSMFRAPDGDPKTSILQFPSSPSLPIAAMLWRALNTPRRQLPRRRPKSGM
jgi:hypothetical protein